MSAAQTEAVVAAVHALRPDLPVVPVTFRPRPIASVEGARAFFATTAPAVLLPTLMEHLEREHGCTVVGATTHLSDRARLRADLAEAAGSYDMVLTELKAAAVDVVAEAGDVAGVPVVFADNVPVAVGPQALEPLVLDLAVLASDRSQGSGRRG